MCVQMGKVERCQGKVPQEKTWFLDQRLIPEGGGNWKSKSEKEEPIR